MSPRHTPLTLGAAAGPIRGWRTSRTRSLTHRLAYFADRGHTVVRRIGAGVEGVVYGLDEGRAAKVWNGRPPADFDLTRQVYADIARHPLPFSTPEIFDVETHEGVLVTHERELPGGPMRVDSAHAASERELPAQHNEAPLAVLRGLASVPGTVAMRQLTVQGDDRPLWQGHDCFRGALAALVARAAARHGAVLAAYVADFEAGVERTRRALGSLPDAPVTTIHGDLVPPNIHIDAAARPVAVLDFGFCTTAGDPAFEAPPPLASGTCTGRCRGGHCGTHRALCP
uniref:Aminoglycoside phosphotransferase family protein n=1 Tax=Streptomyces sp. NBC_01401 TaxID=2903854 RepID=A0AAU3GN12_9ACTN